MKGRPLRFHLLGRAVVHGPSLCRALAFVMVLLVTSQLSGFLRSISPIMHGSCSSVFVGVRSAALVCCWFGFYSRCSSVPMW